MSLIIKKFGGTSLGDVSRLRNVAERIFETKNNGHQIVVVVSAMCGMTDKLVADFNELSQTQDAEYDIVASAGEQISAGLLATALGNLGQKARSWTGWQLPILTDNRFGQAEILKIDTAKLKADLDNDIIPIVTGFQGVNEKGRITTLGRGGSDLTAVALAIALKADKCDIYTDVPGVYTHDPKKRGNLNGLNELKRLAFINYQDMLESIDKGAKVMERRSIEMAMKNKMPIEVLSSFEDITGTIIGETTK